MNRHTDRRIDPDELRKLGVPEEVIKEAVENAKRGLFAIAPPEDVVRKTLDACEAEIRRAGPPGGRP